MAAGVKTWSDVLHARQTVRRFRTEPVPLRVVHRLINAASRAPSAHNRQPWRFCVLQTTSVKIALADAMGRRLRADRLADGDDVAAVEEDVRRSYHRITAAPVVIVVCLSMEDMDRYPDARRSDAEIVMAIQSTAMAGGNLLLAAEGEGLGACWICAPLFCPGEVRDALQLPQHWQSQGLILLGRPAEAGRFRNRKPIGAIMTTR